MVSPHIGGDERLERKHRSWRWLRRPPVSSTVELTPDIVATAAPAISELAPENYGSPAVKTHINHIFQKTGARDRAQAVRYAYQHGLA